MVRKMLVDKLSLNLIANNVGDVYHYYITMYYIHVLLRDYCVRKNSVLLPDFHKLFFSQWKFSIVNFNYDFLNE